MWRNVKFLQIWQNFTFFHICCVENLKFLFMWRNFRFFHICQILKFEMSPHEQFFSTYRKAIYVGQVTNVRFGSALQLWYNEFIFQKSFFTFSVGRIHPGTKCRDSLEASPSELVFTFEQFSSWTSFQIYAFSHAELPNVCRSHKTCLGDNIDK